MTYLPLTRTDDCPNIAYLNILAQEWSAHDFTQAPCPVSQMGDETQEIHARAIAACFETPDLRRPFVAGSVLALEQTRITQFTQRQAD